MEVFLCLLGLVGVCVLGCVFVEGLCFGLCLGWVWGDLWLIYG